MPDARNRGVYGVRDERLDELLATFVHGDKEPPMAATTGGDPRLKLTIVIAIVLPLLAGAVSGAVTWASTYYGVRAEIRDVTIEASTHTTMEIDKHRAEGHVMAPSREEIHELKTDLKEIKATLDRLREDVAVLKARGGATKKRGE